MSEPLVTPAVAPETPAAHRQAFLYLQASIIGTLANFISRFPLAQAVGFELSVILSTYVGMVVVFLLSYRRAFAVRRANAGMVARFVLVAHIGLAVVWVGSTLSFTAVRLLAPELLQPESARAVLENFFASLPAAGGFLQEHNVAVGLSGWLPGILEGACHAFGIVAGFFVNFVGHRTYSFAGDVVDGEGRRRSPDPEGAHASILFAVLVPLAYLALYAPYGIDTTDFGFFYGHPWRILQGEVPFRDFYYTKPPFSLYWHALWLWLTPDRVSVLGGKAGFLVAMLGTAWLGALFLRRAFDFTKLGLPLPLLATAAFVFGVHTFPAMPWHTSDGALFGSAALYAAISGAFQGLPRKAGPGGRCGDFCLGLVAGLLAACAVLVKQSFLFMPPATLLVALAFHSRLRAFGVALGTAGGMGAFFALMRGYGAWEAFRSQTASGFSLGEALDAGVFIYTGQNLWLPCLAALAFPLGLLLHRRSGVTWGASSPRPKGRAANLLALVQPVPLYFLLLAVWYVHAALTGPEWIGFGTSWPMLLIVIGGVLTLLPRFFLAPFAATLSPVSAASRLETALRGIAPSVALGAALTLSWSTGISGGYKAPAFFAAPQLLAAVLLHLFLWKKMTGKEAEAVGSAVQRGNSPSAAPLVWLMLVCGLVMFRAGYERPYVFPIRDMPRSSLTQDAGSVFPRLGGVLTDAESMDILRELKALRAKYGPNYKTLPAFPLAYLLTDDKPALSAEWLQDWEINREVDKVYQELVDKDIVVFFERSQLDTLFPDGHERTRYSVPERVRKQWRQVDETRHFVVFRRP